MQRLTWDGIAMHAGRLPGYPASKGCVRLPVAFAAKLFEVTTNDTTVIITDQKYSPGKTANPGLLLSGKTGDAGQAGLPAKGFVWQPAAAADGPVSVIFSVADSVAYIYRNGVEIGRTAFRFKTGKNIRIRGSHVYSALDGLDTTGRRKWLAVTSIGGGTAPNLRALARDVLIPDEFLRNARSIIAPGTTLILTDLAVSTQTRGKDDFRILTTDDASR
jgi:hypothetical protein